VQCRIPWSIWVSRIDRRCNSSVLDRWHTAASIEYSLLPETDAREAPVCIDRGKQCLVEGKIVAVSESLSPVLNQGTDCTAIVRLCLGVPTRYGVGLPLIKYNLLEEAQQESALSSIK
jgi:hypothetical protein